MFSPSILWPMPTLSPRSIDRYRPHSLLKFRHIPFWFISRKSLKTKFTVPMNSLSDTYSTCISHKARLTMVATAELQSDVTYKSWFHRSRPIPYAWLTVMMVILCSVIPLLVFSSSPPSLMIIDPRLTNFPVLFQFPTVTHVTIWP